MLLVNENIILQNDVVQLLPYNNTHFNAYVKYALTEPNTWQYSMHNPGGSATAMQEYVNFAKKEYNENTSYTFTVLHKATNTIAGCTRLYDINFANSVATIGYTWYGEKYRRTGLNRHCKLLLLSYAFEVWQLQRVEFRADVNNTASIAAMKAIGCTEEGILRSHATLPNALRRTSMVLSILKTEWENGVKIRLMEKIY